MNLLWLQSGGCGGCSISLITNDCTDIFTYFKDSGINILSHPTFSGSGELRKIFEQILSDKISLDLLCFEGAVLRGPAGTGKFHLLSGTGIPMLEWVQRLSAKASYTIAVGSCASFGGMTSAGGNPTDACGLQYEGRLPGGALGADYRSQKGLPVINVSGCPIHPEWLTDLLSLISQDMLHSTDLDQFQRPGFYTRHLVHHGCLRNEYYEYKASAEKPSDQGCLMENLGCLATQAQGDCNIRLWHKEGSCIRGGFACINCTAPGFENPGYPLTQTPKIAGIPVGLPIDMPKAWFVALNALAKAATPERLKKNAVSDHIKIPPEININKKHR
jgi:ferredoxin hydrogenase small subunit